MATLPGVISGAPKESTLCVYHTHTLNQFTEADRTAFYEILLKSSGNRPVYVVSSENRSEKYASVEIDSYVDGERTTQKLAYCDPHAKWMRWLPD